MADKQRVALGPVGETLMRNIKRIRKARQLHQKDVSALLKEAGRPMLSTVVSKIERGERRVDVDDLLAIAHVLGVTPVDLLMPLDVADDEPYAIAPKVSAPTAAVRGWISGQTFLTPPATAAELAEAIRWMPEERARTLASEWLKR